jgi:type III secretion system-like peptide-binding chaperone
VTSNPDRPAEASLYDDPATADLAAKVMEAWDEFGRALTLALPLLPVGARLELTLDPTASGVEDAYYAVSVTPTGGAQIQAYAVSNATLPREHRLSRTAIGELVALGWSPPGVLPGTQARFGLTLPTAQAARIAAIVGRTLRDVYGVPHPAFLVYMTHPAAHPHPSEQPGGQPGERPEKAGEQPAGAGEQPAAVAVAEPVELPRLGAARPVAEDGQASGLPDLSTLPLPAKVAAVIAAMLNTTPDNLTVDTDGDIGIRSGSAMVFVRVRDNPPLIDVFSPVLTGVVATEQLYIKLSDLTHRMPIGRLYYASETVWASVPVFGRDFQPTHLMVAVQVMTGLADELDDRLHGEFGGRRFFAEGDASEDDADADSNGDTHTPNHADAENRTGMYL